MRIQAYLENPAAFIATVAMALVPFSSLAGGYGSAGVADATVSQYRDIDSVWCQKLEANIPAELFGQMDCGQAATGVARSAVADDRITNRDSLGLRNFLSNFRHIPGRTIPTDDDGPSLRVTNVREDGHKPNPTPTSNVGKWERLSDFGVTHENFGSQSEEFREQVGEYRSTHGVDGDWSGFSPD